MEAALVGEVMIVAITMAVVLRFTDTERTGLCPKIYHDVRIFCARARPEDNPRRCIFCRDRVGGQWLR
ncbi:MAG TPA: hypothetical protein VLA62_00500 [Solirubrobacterales bacterium]|nr:hypothetical protein [Solirubrobacterales bacterium]